MARYTFSYQQHDPNNSPYPEFTTTEKTVDFGECADPWTPVLYEFCNFLSGIYGYNITEQVFVSQYSFESDDKEMVALNEAL